MYQTDAYLRSIEYLRDQVPDQGQYPFNLPVIQQLTSLKLHPKVTYFVGENGMGKSTLLEAVAVAWGFNPEGGGVNFNFSTHASHSNLHEHLRLVKGLKKPRDGFFFRAESYYNVASDIERMDQEPAPGSRIIDSYGGKSLHAQSHGESFFSTFIHRFFGNGLYILDEPEAALSPSRQLALLAQIHQLVLQRSQFIISTHSPILMSYPDSILYQLEPDDIRPVKLEETDHFRVTKAFLDHPGRMLRELMETEEN